MGIVFSYTGILEGSSFTFYKIGIHRLENHFIEQLAYELDS
jgi:hypothetical protein